MAITCELNFDGPGGVESAIPTNSFYHLNYNIIGTDPNDFATAKSTLYATAPSSYLGYNLSAYGVDPVPGSTTCWKGYANYSNLGGFDPTITDYSFDTGGFTAKRLFAREHLGDFKGSEDGAGIFPPNHRGAIGVTQDGHVEGVEIPYPIYNWSEALTVPAASVTTSYKLALFNLTGRMNHAAWKGFSKGEVLFLGAQGTQQNGGAVKINFKFSSLPNETNIPVSPTLSIPFKYGWDYLWAEFENDVSDHHLITRPAWAHTERVFLFGDMTLLGIGS